LNERNNISNPRSSLARVIFPLRQSDFDYTTLFKMLLRILDCKPLISQGTITGGGSFSRQCYHLTRFLADKDNHLSITVYSLMGGDQSRVLSTF
jgi:hypothetical protein